MENYGFNFSDLWNHYYFGGSVFDPIITIKTNEVGHKVQHELENDLIVQLY